MTELTAVELTAVTGGDGNQDADHAAYRASHPYFNPRAYSVGMGDLGLYRAFFGPPAPKQPTPTERLSTDVDNANARRAAVQNGGLMGAITIPHH